MEHQIPSHNSPGEPHVQASKATGAAPTKMRQGGSLCEKLALTDFETDISIGQDHKLLDLDDVIEEAVLPGAFQSVHDSAPVI